jgi:hypothetical protein
VNVFSQSGARYPQISSADLQRANPELVLLSSEPYPFKKEHIREIQNLLPEAKILLTDGELWSWYGSRMKRFPFLIPDLLRELSPLTQC